RNAGDEIEETASKSVNFKDGFGSVVGLGDGIDRLSESLRGNGDAWQTAVSAVESAIQIYDGIQSVIGIIQALTGVNTAATAATTASSVAEVTAATTKTATTTAEITASAGLTAATKLEAAAFRELAASEFMAAHAYIPFAGFGIAAGFIGAMQGLIAATAIPFANGGLLYGPTLALMGEYAGARTNPEVVAPLDKLRSLIGDASGGRMNGKVEFKIKRGNLVGVMENDARHRQRV
ncbi:MAG: hypothetical protein HUJ99_05985, partial [Bacteroidaceae bacterium]|nr:hypothetical protein [Bacteroidaceae bacterium]